MKKYSTLTLAILLTIILAFSCVDEEDEILKDEPRDKAGETIITEDYGNATVLGVVRDKSGNALSGVRVFFGEEKVTSSGDGKYTLSTVSAGKDKRIWFEKDGFASTQKLINVTESVPNRVDASLYLIAKSEEMDQSGGTISGDDFSVEIPENAFVYASDSVAVKGNVTVEVTPFLITDTEFFSAFPGNFEGVRESDGSSTAIESYGFIDVSLSSDGEKVQLKEGTIATIKIKAPSNNPPSTIPMWYYDEMNHQWLEQGEGHLEGEFYTAEVSHFTKWNWDKPYAQTAKITGRVVGHDGTDDKNPVPLAGAKVVQTGKTYTFQNVTRTKDDGTFELITPDGGFIKIEAYYEYYGSTIVYNTSPSGEGRTKNIGDIEIDIKLDDTKVPSVNNDTLYVVLGEEVKIKGIYFGREKKANYRLLLNGEEVQTVSWNDQLIKFDIPDNVPETGLIQIDRDGVLSEVTPYLHGDWLCEIAGKGYDIDTDSLSLIQEELQDLGYFECITTLTNLEYINLTYNNFKSIPQSISNLKNLKYLALHFNNIKLLPEGILELENLEFLGLDYTDLQSLPQDFGKLTNLKSLTLYFNMLYELPESFINLQNLTSLDLQENGFNTFPEIISDLTNLEGLNIGNNFFGSLPKSIGNLENLESLLLFDCYLDSIPETIGNLTKLKNLNLSDNKLTNLPESIGDLTSLNELKLNENQLTTLPESIKNLKDNLIELKLGKNNFSDEEKAKIESWLPNTTIYW